jgi:hypothetical protein
MALLIPAHGDPIEVHPTEGRTQFTLAEMRAYLGGYLEVVTMLPDGRIAWCNEEGKLLQLPLNRFATALLLPQLRGDYIVGPLLITTRAEAGEEDDEDEELRPPLDDERLS